MASATQILLPSLTLQSIPQHSQPVDSRQHIILSNGSNNTSKEDHMDEAIRLAGLCRTALNKLNARLPSLSHSHAYTPTEILALPLATNRIPDELHSLPRRRSARHELAAELASLLDPAHDGSLTALIRYETDRVRLRAWAALQRKFDKFEATKRNGNSIESDGVHTPIWWQRITGQGPWDFEKHPVSLKGVTAIPMPVQVAKEQDLAPFLGHLRHNGTHILNGDEGAQELDQGKGEPYYGVAGAEFKKGVVYSDGRMDLCKVVVGPDHIWSLMDSLRHNEFVQHFLLGNNIIGPSGARAIAKYIREFPDRMDTWYLAGNCIDGQSLGILVNALVRSEAVTNIWMKRNPLGSGAADDLYRLITQTKNLRTLDVDQTELGDEGITTLFNKLAAYQGTLLPLEHIYMNGNGISVDGAKAIASFLQSPACGLTSVYMSLNPLGDAGAQALASALPNAPNLTRLLLQSVGVSTQGAVALCEAVTGHPSIRAFCLGQAYATEDLGQAYNYIEDGAVPALEKMLMQTKGLQYFNLGHCAISPTGVQKLVASVIHSKSFLYYNVISVIPDADKPPITFTPSKDPTCKDLGQRSVAEIELSKTLRSHLEGNVRAHYGDLTYADFMEEEKRWLVNDRDVRKIDSVYRNRDAGLARRRLMTLAKEWEEGNETLEKVMNASGPVCALPVGA